MQIDFHHGVTYVVARLAGFSKSEAETVAYASQYVDDATNSGAISFTNGAMYSRISSAHKMLDYRNFQELANHLVWIPFHFLPGNGGKAAGKNPSGTFIRKLVCKPNSYVAQDMVRACIHCHDKPYALHRLGITMHVYADTWAHQGFAGVNHKINEVHNLANNLSAYSGYGSFLDKAKDYFGNVFDKKTSSFLGGVFPLGHGAALSHPDMPFLKWSYTNGLGEVVKRNNLKDFLEAVKFMFQQMIRFRKKDPDYVVTESISDQDLSEIRANFVEFQDESGQKRHQKWLDFIAGGRLSFGAETLTYIHKGRGSWKWEALKTEKEKETKDEKFAYEPAFLSSNWKLFHDALQTHRMEVIKNILPRYGICAG